MAVNFPRPSAALLLPAFCAAAAIVIAALLLAGNVSLGDNEGFATVRGKVFDEASYAGEVAVPIEDISVSARVLSNGTVLYAQERVSLDRFYSYIYNFFAIEPVYECFDASYGAPGRTSFVCPDTFTSMEAVAREEARIAMERSRADPEQQPGGRHTPFAFILVDGRTGRMDSFSSARSPSYKDLMGIAKKPATLFSYNSSARRLAISAYFAPPEQQQQPRARCLSLGVAPQRRSAYDISAQAALLNYTVSGPAPAPQVLNRDETSLRLLFEDANRSNTDVSVLSVCFAAAG